MGAEKYIAVVVTLFLLSASADAELQSRRLGQAYYDTALDITWIADGNLAATHPFGVSGMGTSTSGFGAMDWATARAWIAGMNAARYLGVDDWRLPTVIDTDGPDPDALGDDGCNLAYAGTDCGWNVDPATGEIAHLYYVTLGNIGSYDPNGVHQDWCDSGMPAPPACLINVGPFTNFFPNHYWTGTECAADATQVWEFNARIGAQNINVKTRISHVWAVHDGDIDLVVATAVDDGPVPVSEGVAGIIPVGANDTGFSSPASVSVITPPAKGTIGAISAPGSAAGITVSYTANIGASGVDSFLYEMKDGTPASDVATVIVNIGPDTDSDGIPDVLDNCRLVANPTQCDSDGDGFGNHCDADLNNNTYTNAQDFVLLRQQLGKPSISPLFNEADINCNGVVNAQDRILFQKRLGSQPGPSVLVP